MKYLVLLLVLIVGGVSLFMGYFLISPAGTSTDKIVFQIKQGASFGQVARQLEDKGLITNNFQLRVLAKVNNSSTNIKVGEYMLNKGMSPLEILDILKTGKSIEYVVTFPEGHNMYEMAEILHKKGFIKKEDFLKQASDKAFIKGLLGGGYETLEGYLFPDTYNISKATSAKSFIKTMVQKFLDTYKALKNGKMTRHQVVTLASIIEKETGAPEERPLISSVFHNRLRKSMRLQTDPTVLYGIMDKTGSMKKNITRKDLTTPTRYNTYTFKGLPHGPIANPGIMSLRAALSPSTSEFLYFVSKK